ncbi:hypothetical protein LCGC14_2573960, partial [marine sediment metagenome]
MAVTENAEGTMVEAEGIETPEAEPKTPGSESKVSPKEEKVEQDPKLYSQKDYEAAVQIIKSDEGRTRTELESEKDDLSKRVTEIETDVEEVQAERDKLQVTIEELTSDDPKKFDLIKRDRELREQQKLLKKGTEDLAAEVKVHEGRVTLANETLLEIAIWEVATEYKGSDPVKLKNLCTTLGITDEAKLREVAGGLWEKAEGKAPTKKTEEVEREKLDLDDGATSGGGGETTEQEVLDNLYPTMKKI